jgi:hypothetical protein
VSRQEILEARAKHLLEHGGFDGLQAWLKSLSEADQYLLQDCQAWLDDQKPKLFDRCPSHTCKAEQIIWTDTCCICGYKEAA